VIPTKTPRGVNIDFLRMAFMLAVGSDGATYKPAGPCAPGVLGEDGSMRTVAILGASANRNKFGNKAVRAFVQQGYTVFHWIAKSP
jgi:hypothetical protein